jgi:hypothetical protein
MDSRWPSTLITPLKFCSSVSQFCETICSGVKPSNSTSRGMAYCHRARRCSNHGDASLAQSSHVQPRQRLRFRPRTPLPPQLPHKILTNLSTARLLHPFSPRYSNPPHRQQRKLGCLIHLRRRIRPFRPTHPLRPRKRSSRPLNPL